METDQLKPCPFCGGLAHFIFESMAIFVKCSDCGAHGKHHSRFLDELDAAEKAVDAWNTRPYPSDTEELRRAVAVIGIVGQIDGHDVVRRNSVLEIIDRRVAA